MAIIGAAGIPEAPNLFTLLRDYFGKNRWTDYFQAFEGIFFSVVAAALISLIFYLGARNKEMVPKGLQNFLEWVVENFRNVVLGIMGPEGEPYVPFLGTLFIYIFTMNLLGLIPLMKSPSSNFNVTIGLAITVFGYVQYLNIKHMGFRGFLYHLAGSPKSLIEWVLVPLMLPIEILTQVSRPITLALRLFGNIMGEKILVGFFALASVTVFYFFPVQMPFLFLGILTGVMQALVFTLLSTIYIFLALPHKH